MGEDLQAYKRRVYSRLVVYFVPDQKTYVAAGTPSLLVPSWLGRTRRDDVAPYLTEVDGRELFEPALRAIQARSLPAEDERETRQFLEELAVNISRYDCAWVQLEPEEIAGRGTADIEQDQNVPRGE